MAEPTEQPVECEEEVDNPNYKPPAQKSLNEIQQLDQDDESLRKYKETLLGKDKGGEPKPGDPRNVIVEKVCFCPEGRDEIEINLGDLKEAERKSIVVKEGSQYRIKIYFYVQREIVCGLRCIQKTTRKGIKVDSHSWMVGSYGPKSELQEYKTAIEDIPSGMLARGSYNVKTKFTDDDTNSILEWEFKMEIKKDWN